VIHCNVGRNGNNCETRVRLLRSAAHKGNTEAQIMLANLYFQGTAGLPEDPSEGVRLLKLAATQGSAHAQSRLSQMYSVGYIVPKDEREAQRLQELASRPGKDLAGDGKK